MISFILLFASNNELYAQKKKSKAKSDEVPYVYQIDKRELEIQGYFIEGVQQKVLGNSEDAIGLFNTVIRLDNKNHAAYYELSRIHFERDEIEKAVEYGKKATELYKKNEWYYVYLAEAQADLGEFVAAAKTYEELTKNIEDGYDYHFDRAYMLTKAKKYEEAISVYNELEDRYGINEEIILLKENLYIKLGKVDLAAKEVQKLIDENPEDIRYYGMLGELYEANGMYKEAKTAYNKLLETNPESIQGQLALADLLKKEGNRGEYNKIVKKVFGNKEIGIDTKIMILLPYLEGLSLKDTNNYKDLDAMSRIISEAHPKDPKAHVARGDILYHTNKPEEALISYKKAVDIGDNPITVWHQLFAILSENGNFEELNLYSDKGIKAHPEVIIPYFYKGIANQQTENHQEAAKVYQKGLQLKNVNPEIKGQILSNLGDIHNELKNYQSSDSCFDAALVIDPNNAFVLNNYAYYLTLRVEKLDQAKSMSKKSNLLVENNAAFQDTYAWILYQKGEYEEAKEWMEKALKNIDSDRPVLLEHYGDILFKVRTTRRSN